MAGSSLSKITEMKGLKTLVFEMELWQQRLHVISSYAISTAAISTVYTFNRWPFRPLANLTACKLNRHKFDLFN